MLTFEEYAEGYDSEFVQYLRSYYEFGLRSRSLSSDLEEMISYFKVIHSAGLIEAILDELDAHLYSEEPEVEIEIDDRVFEYFPDDMVFKMIETSYNIGLYLYSRPKYTEFDRPIKSGKLIGAFLLGLGFDPQTYMRNHINSTLDYINDIPVSPN